GPRSARPCPTRRSSDLQQLAGLIARRQLHLPQLRSPLGPAQQSPVPVDEAVGLGRGLVELDQVTVSAVGPAHVAETAVQHLLPRSEEHTSELQSRENLV